jgi:sugar lactone lactonase YvrE
MPAAAGVIASGFTLAECPVWVPEAQRLLWVDAGASRLHVRDPAGLRSVPIAGDLLSAVAVDEDGRLVVVVDRQVRRQVGGSVDAPEFALLATLPEDPPGVQANDAQPGPDGRLWIGTVARGRRGAAALWSVDPAGRVERHLEGVTHGNGLAWSADGRTLWFADSGERTVTRYEVRDGGLGPGRTVLHLERGEGIPDGLAVDADDTLWLGVWDGGCLLHLDGEGEPLGRVELAERNVTSCAFAGSALDLLAVTTAQDDVHPGAVHLLDVGAVGRPGQRMGGA